VEAWGRGIENMCKLCADNAVKTEYTVHPCDVMLEFSIPQLENSEKRTEIGDFGSQKSSQKSSQKIIELIEGNPFITTQKIADSLGISRRAIAKTIAKLQQKGLLQRIGPDKGGYWQIQKNA
jgi:ATP-dependent DNA helicase RecG